MEEQEVNLGIGIVRNLVSIPIEEKGVPIENIWDTLEDFGIIRNETKEVRSFVQKSFTRFTQQLEHIE